MNTNPLSARRPAAVVMAAGLLLAACGDGGSRFAGDTTTTTTTTTAPEASYRPAGPPADLGAGELAGVTGDGAAAYVAAQNPSSSVPGCEGMPAPHLYRAPLDGASRTLAAPAGAQPLAGEVLRRRGSTTVVVVDQCEGFLSRVLVATEESGGTLRDVKELDRRLVAEVAPLSLNWSAAGDTLLGVRDRREVLRIDPVKGTSERLAEVQEGVKAVELADGTLVVLTADALTVGGRPVDVRADSVTGAPDGRRLAAGSEDGLVLVEPDGTTRRLADGPATAPVWSPHGDAVAFHAQDALRVVALDGTVTDIATNVIPDVRFTPDGGALVFNRIQDVGQGMSDVHVAVVRFASPSRR